MEAHSKAVYGETAAKESQLLQGQIQTGEGTEPELSGRVQCFGEKILLEFEEERSSQIQTAPKEAGKIQPREIPAAQGWNIRWETTIRLRI